MILTRDPGEMHCVKWQMYDSMKSLYMAKEAAITCDLYAEHIDHLVQHHADMTGFLGST